MFKRVREMLKFKPTRQKRQKLFWTQQRNEIIVTRGTPQSDFRKTIFRRTGTAAVPRHIREVLELTIHKEERMLWM